MKCYNCPALRREYETGDEYCAIRNIDELKNGCHLSLKTIRKAIEESIKAQCEEYGRMVKFFDEVEEREQQNAFECGVVMELKELLKESRRLIDEYSRYFDIKDFYASTDLLTRINAALYESEE